MLKPSLALHLHLQQHHRLLRRAGCRDMRPEHPIEAMVHRFDVRGVKAVERIARRIRSEREQRRSPCSTHGGQQQRDQIRRALEQAIEPVVCFQSPPPDNTRPTASPLG
jgi:ABC-type histidine transport system ATPase subunit